MSILVTGGAGYIGSHTLVELIYTGYDPLVLDNFSNSCEISLARVEKITGKKINYIVGDIRDSDLLAKVFKNYDVQSVLHFAGLKSVSESVSCPLKYYDNNVSGTNNLLSAMSDAGVFEFVFSSSATVYGLPVEIPISENSPTSSLANPYGRSKLMVEDILKDLARADSRWRIALLRYFNPIGAHHSGLIGEDPNGIPNNLLPYLTQVASGKRPFLPVFGNNYRTIDGTGVRDYIHVTDLAKGHVAALEYFQNKHGVHTWNLGTGEGYSVLQIVQAFEKVNGTKILYEIKPPRSGDVAVCYANCDKANRELGWTAKKRINEMLADAWHWQKNNPNGYRV